MCLSSVLNTAPRVSCSHHLAQTCWLLFLSPAVSGCFSVQSLPFHFFPYSLPSLTACSLCVLFLFCSFLCFLTLSFPVLPAAVFLDIQTICSAIAAGRLSATVFKLELELKSLRSSHGAKPLQPMQTMQSSSDQNSAAQMAVLIRKAAAAQEAADSAQQQLSQATRSHAQQMAGAQAAVESTQQDLRCTSHSLTQLQQKLAAARQSHADQAATLQQQHADQVAELQQKHAEQSAAIRAGCSGTLAALETALSEAKSSLASTREQHAKRLAELQQCFNNQLTAAASKHEVMLAASHAELAAARQHSVQQSLDLDQGSRDKLAQPQPLHSFHPLLADPQHSTAVAQVSSQFASAAARRPPHEAFFQHLAASSRVQAKLMTLEQGISQTAANAEAQAVTAGESECTTLRQRITALEKQLALAQAEILVHASTSVGRFELVCSLKAAAQGSKHCWTATDHVQQMQQLLQSVAGVVLKQTQADHTVAVAGDSQQHAVTSATRAKEEHGSAGHYPSDEDDLDDWTQEGDDDDSDADCAKETDSADTAAGGSQSAWVISAGVTDCSSSHSRSSFPQCDQAQSVTDAAPSCRAETVGTAPPDHVSQGSPAEVLTSSSAQMSRRSFPTAKCTVLATAVEPNVINSQPEHTLGAQAMPAAKSGISSVSHDAGCTKGDHSCEVTGVGVAKIVSSSVTGMHPSEENDLDDWTCDEDDACAVGGYSYAAINSTLAEIKSSSAPNHYPSDEDDLDDWTQEDDD